MEIVTDSEENQSSTKDNITTDLFSSCISLYLSKQNNTDCNFPTLSNQTFWNVSNRLHPIKTALSYATKFFVVSKNHEMLTTYNM